MLRLKKKWERPLADKVNTRHRSIFIHDKGAVSNYFNLCWSLIRDRVYPCHRYPHSQRYLAGGFIYSWLLWIADDSVRLIAPGLEEQGLPREEKRCIDSDAERGKSSGDYCDGIEMVVAVSIGMDNESLRSLSVAREVVTGKGAASSGHKFSLVNPCNPANKMNHSPSKTQLYIGE